jgi:hypothetical protein
MIQIGKISKRGPVGPERYSKFTEDELYTHMTFWCIYRSPLMLGGNLPDNREIEEKLFSNEEVLKVNQEGSNPRQIYKQDGSMIWMSDAPGGDKYVALFNISDGEKVVTLDFALAGLKKKNAIRDLWKQTDLGSFTKKYATAIPAHGTVLLKVASSK